MPDPSPFATLVPGFDFLQSLVKNAGTAMPGMGQWASPTLNPEELEKRIEELRTVQFWLEQNVRMLAATIQGLEVQRMTLATLKSMNVQMSDLHHSMKLPEQAAKLDPLANSAASTVDPMQWWNALTQQFTQLAASAAQDQAALKAHAAAAASCAKASTPAAPAPSGQSSSPGTRSAPSSPRKRAAPKG